MNKRLYLRTYDYNVAKVMNELVKIILKKGGKVKKPLCDTYSISDRYLEEECQKVEEILHKIDKRGRNEHNEAYARKKEKEYARISNINNEPIECDYLNYITFILDGYFYYFQIEDNVFFPARCEKAKIVTNKESYFEEISNNWKSDELLSFGLGDRQVTFIAEKILALLQSKMPKYVGTDNRGLHIDMANFRSE